MSAHWALRTNTWDMFKKTIQNFGLTPLVCLQLLHLRAKLLVGFRHNDVLSGKNHCCCRVL